MKYGLTGRVADNVHCGTVDYKGNRLSGCGRLTETLESIDRVEGYEGLWTTSHYCAECRSKSKAKRYKTEYRTVDTSTLEGLKTAERLHASGWKTYRTGLFLVYFQKRVRA